MCLLAMNVFGEMSIQVEAAQSISAGNKLSAPSPRLGWPPKKKHQKGDKSAQIKGGGVCGGLGEHVPSEQACALDFFFFFFLFHQVFIAAHRLSLVAASEGCSSSQCTDFSSQWLLLSGITGSRCMGFSNCSTQAQYLWQKGLVALQHVTSSWTRD